jgi:hypothetical protein
MLVAAALGLAAVEVAAVAGESGKGSEPATPGKVRVELGLREVDRSARGQMIAVSRAVRRGIDA